MRAALYTQRSEPGRSGGLGLRHLVLFLCVCSGCCASMYLWNPSQETWHFSSTTVRREADCHPTSYSLSYLQVYGREYSAVFGEDAMQSTLLLWGMRASLLPSPESKIVIETLISFSSREMILSQRSFPEQEWLPFGGFCFGGFFFVWVGGFFKISAYNIEWMLLYFLPAQKILVGRDAV